MRTVILGVIATFAVFIASVWVRAIVESVFHYEVDRRVFFGVVGGLCVCIVVGAICVERRRG
jgi:hypothetical protein